MAHAETFLYFAPLVIGHRATQGGLKAIEDCAETLCRVNRSGTVALDQGDKQRRAIDQHANLRAIARTLDEIAFSVAGDETLSHFNGTLFDTRHVGNQTAPVLPLRSLIAN